VILHAILLGFAAGWVGLNAYVVWQIYTGREDGE